jgi:hypothetical protein
LVEEIFMPLNKGKVNCRCNNKNNNGNNKRTKKVRKKKEEKDLK